MQKPVSSIAPSKTERRHKSTTQEMSSTIENQLEEHLRIKKIPTFLYTGQEKENILKMGIVHREKQVTSLENILNE